MKSWPEWFEFWKLGLAECNNPTAPEFVRALSGAALKAEFIEQESAMRATVDVACGQFAEFCDWPELNADVRWFVWLRLFNAAELSAMLAAPFQGEAAVVPAPQMDDEAMREWFLLWLWSGSVSRWAERVARDAGGSNPDWLPGSN
jgi:hypothetical protein